MFKFMRGRKQNQRFEFQDSWLDDLDAESKQETVIKYLRSLDNRSLKNLYDAVDKYREGDKILGRVKEPEPEKTSEDESEELANE